MQVRIRIDQHVIWLKTCQRIDQHVIWLKTCQLCDLHDDQRWFINIPGLPIIGEYTWVLYRYDGPAIEFPNSGRWWYRYGKLHRNNGPAIEFTNGSQWWYQYGKLHRNNGPAIEFTNGSRWLGMISE